MIDTAKTQRKERGKAVEGEVRRAFREYETPIEDRAAAGLLLVGDKMVRDLQDQLAQVIELRGGSNSKYAEQEVARLLRMMEKRKAMLDQLQDALAIDEDLARRAEAMLAAQRAS